MIRSFDTTIAARDGYPLAATIFEPETPASDAIVALNSATAVPRKIYGPFAKALAVRGATVITYDYRGIGGSRPPRLRGFHARMRDWAALDAAGVIDHAVAHYPNRRVLGVGHSFGGQAFGIMPGNARLDRVLMVAAQAGYWRLLAGAERWRVYAILKALVPAVALPIGFVPGKRLGLGEDLPLGVFLEWRRWCLLPRYYYDDKSLDLLGNLSTLRAPALAVGLSDDAWATPAAIDLLVSQLASPVERRTVTPAEIGARKIGHFGFFRAEHQKTLWPDVTDWLLAT